MVLSFNKIRDSLGGKTAFFEAIKDENGVQGLSLSFDVDGKLEHHYIVDDSPGFEELVGLLLKKPDKVCWDARNWRLLGQEYNEKFCDIIDVSFYYKEDSLIRAANSNLTDSEVEKLSASRRELSSHIRACRTAKIKLKDYPLQDVVPRKTLANYYELRNNALKALWDKISDEWKEDFTYNVYPKVAAYYDIEKGGIFVNANIEFEDSAGNNRFISDIIRRVNNEYNAGVVYTGFNLTHTTRTGRVHPLKNSFGCMNIPKTTVRRAVMSSKDGGLIASIDMNAADYRCIVATINNKYINSIYDGCDDFHDRTVEYIFGKGNSTKVRRDTIKRITYTAIYGGSIEKLATQTGLSEGRVKLVLEKLKAISEPITEFSKELFDKSKRDGFVTDMLGKQITLKGNEHQGQILALFAQTCCSIVFMDGVVELHRFLKGTASRLLFTVHDEVVLDIDRDDVHLVEEMKDKLELGASRTLGASLKAEAKIGPNYWDMK